MPLLPFLAFLQVRQEALIEMCFNMGSGNLDKFKMMIASLAQEDWEAAADESLLLTG